MRQAVTSLLRLEETTDKSLLEMLNVAFQGTPVLMEAIEAARERIDPLRTAGAEKEIKLRAYKKALTNLERGQGGGTIESLQGTPQRSVILKGAHDVILEHLSYFEQMLRGRKGVAAGELLAGFLRANPAQLGPSYSPRFRQCNHGLYATTILTRVSIGDDLMIDEETATFLKEMLQKALEFAKFRDRSYEIDDDFVVEIGRQGQREACISPNRDTTAGVNIRVKKLLIPPHRESEGPEDDDPDLAKTLYGVIKHVIGRENGLRNRHEGFKGKDFLRRSDAVQVMVQTILGDEAGTRIETCEEFVDALARATFKKILRQEIVSLEENSYEGIVENSEKPWDTTLGSIVPELEKCRRAKVKQGEPAAAIDAVPSAELEPIGDIEEELKLLKAAERYKIWAWLTSIFVDGGVKGLEGKFASPGEELMTLHDLYRTAELLHAEGKRIYEAGEKALGAELVALAEALFNQAIRGAVSFKARGTIPFLRGENPIEVWDRGLTHVEDEVRRSLSEVRSATVVLSEARDQEDERRSMQQMGDLEIEQAIRGCEATLPRRRDTFTGADRGPIRQPQRQPVRS